MLRIVLYYWFEIESIDAQFNFGEFVAVVNQLVYLNSY